MANLTRPGRTNSFRVATVILYFQKFPGTDSSSGIANVPYTLVVDGSVVRRGTTGTDGRIVLNFDRTKTAVLDIFGSQLNITAENRIERVNTIRGIQKRLNMLGYNVGNIDGSRGLNTEREILNFQTDNAPLVVDGLAGGRTQRSLRNKVGE